MKRFLLALLFIISEYYLYSTYQNHDARFHWFTHFFIGGIVALLFMTLYTYKTGQGVRFPLLWILLAHLFGMIPDLLFNIAHIVHKPWMDIFLLHITGHFFPGRNLTWYVLFMASLGWYLTVLHKKTVASQ